MQAPPRRTARSTSSLLTDGLRAEREQGITIDVAYRYFATPRRTFIIADTPGHVQYTRNMVTGASTADLALVLVDARNGVVEQSRRHAFIASLLRHPAPRRRRQQDGPRRLERGALRGDRRGVHRLRRASSSSPTSRSSRSARCSGDNVVDRSANMPWYDGPPLLDHLEHVHVASDRNLIDPRFPVQWVIRPGDASAASTTTAATRARSPAGVCAPGDEVVVLPAGATTHDRRRSTPSTASSRRPFPPMSVTLRLDDDVDVSRGDMIVRPDNRPTSAASSTPTSAG